MRLEALEEVLHTLKEIDKGVLAGLYVFGRL